MKFIFKFFNTSQIVAVDKILLNVIVFFIDIITTSYYIIFN
jgi:hypothetical protein